MDCLTERQQEVLTENEVQRRFAKLIKQGLDESSLLEAEELLDELSPESNVRHKLSELVHRVRQSVHAESSPWSAEHEYQSPSVDELLDMLPAYRGIKHKNLDSGNLDSVQPESPATRQSPSYEQPSTQTVDEQSLVQIQLRLSGALEQIRAQLQDTLKGMAGRDWGSFEANRDIARQIQKLLQDTSSRVLCPKTGIPGNLRHRSAGGTKNGAFGIEIVEDGRRTVRFTSTTFPALEVVAAPVDPRRKSSRKKQ